MFPIGSTDPAPFPISGGLVGSPDAVSELEKVTSMVAANAVRTVNSARKATLRGIMLSSCGGV
jgi:hypothetical protein